jgi:glutamate-1-semialdehyde 2,1-aminomutase
MRQLAPEGPVYQAGTLSGNPLAMAAGLTTLKAIERPGFYQALSDRTRQLIDGLQISAREAGVPLAAEAIGGMFGLVFSADAPVRHFRQVAAADIDRFRKFFHGMLQQGIYFAPSAFEAGFMSAAHGEEEISRTIDASRLVFRQI